MSFGIVYLSLGLNYVDCTIAALQSKIKYAPRTPATVITNRKADLASKICKAGGIQLQYVDIPDREVRAIKTQVYKYSPYERTLLLDADAWINQELADQFKLLDYTPLALTHAFWHPAVGTAAHTGATDREYTVKAYGGLRYIPQYASGMIFFNRDDENVRRMFDVWLVEWQRFHNKDQLALIRAILQTRVFPLVLANKYWLTDVQGKGFISHRFTQPLPSMPRKDAHSPRRYACIP